LLCDPEPVFTFDLTTLTPDQSPRLFAVRKPVVQQGQVDGICMYFKASFDDDIAFSTGPRAAKTHWPMLLYRTPARIYRAFESFEMQVEAPDLSDHRGWSWQIGCQESAG
jgi:protein arginine N-methyltransferase 1